jgi:tyrosyl-tRNA synthetase
MNELQELLTRGVANIIPNKKLLEEKLASGEKLNIYLGIDPTAPNIHLGHSVALRKLQRFAALGHNVTFLVGDFTAKIGDTSDKETERPQLSDEEIKSNLETYKKQAEKIIDFEKVEIRFNSEWLSRLSFEETIRLIGKFSLNDFISRELIKKRLNEGKSVGLLETIYPVMQGYDSMILNTDLQIGGTDQTFNMQAGRALLKDKKESFVMATEFLSGTDGRKMSKTWGNAIWLTDKPEEIFGKVMSITDSVVIEYFTLATNVPFSNIEEFKKELETAPMQVKKKLAHIIVSELYGNEKADKAKENFEKTVQNKELPSDIKKIETGKDILVVDFIANNNLLESRSEAKRLIEQGGIVFNEHKVDLFTKISENGILKIGKRNFIEVNIK